MSQSHIEAKVICSRAPEERKIGALDSPSWSQTGHNAMTPRMATRQPRRNRGITEGNWWTAGGSNS